MENLSQNPVCFLYCVLRCITHTVTKTTGRKIHFQTVTDFLKQHTRVQMGSRWLHQTYFAKYLVTQYWLKMQRWIKLWSSEGYRSFLGTVCDSHITGWVHLYSYEISAMYTDQHNHGLAALVLEMVQDETMESFIMGPSRHSEWSLTHLLVIL